MLFTCPSCPGVLKTLRFPAFVVPTILLTDLFGVVCKTLMYWGCPKKRKKKFIFIIYAVSSS